TKERIDAALEEASKAKKLQDEILSQVDSLGALATQPLGGYTTANVAAFVQRAAALLGMEIEASSDPENFIIRLPMELRGAFHEFGDRTVIAATTRRRNWAPESDVALIDFSGSFLRYLVQTVTAAEFGGSYATLSADSDYPKFFAIFLARFQDDQGHH